MELSSLFLAGKGSALTSFFSTAFLVVFLPFCLVVYSLMPRRWKKYFLLAADCAFFWQISGKLLVYLLLTALSMHYFGLWLDKIQSETKLLLAQTEKAERKTVRKRQQAVQHRILLLAVILHIGVLFALKYSGFAATNVNTLLAHLHIPVQLAIPKYVMPIGISFFTLQALSYIVDVQRGDDGHESAAPDAVHQLLPADRGRADLPLRPDRAAALGRKANHLREPDARSAAHCLRHDEKGHHRRPAQPAREKCL